MQAKVWQLLFSWSVRLQRWSGKHDAVCMTSSILYCGSQGRSVTGTYLTAVWTCRALIYPKIFIYFHYFICFEQASDHGHDLHSAPRALLMEPYKTPWLLVQFGGSRIFRFMGFIVYYFNHHFGIYSIFNVPIILSPVKTEKEIKLITTIIWQAYINV